jgi:hypothetical protein
MAKRMRVVEEEHGVDLAAIEKDWEDANVNRGRFAPQEPGNFPIRILPPLPNLKGKYYVHFGMHYDVAIITGGEASKRSVVCLEKTLEQECPVCKAVNGMFAEARAGEVEDKHTLDRAKKVRARERWVMNVVNMDKPRDGVLTWEIGRDAYAKLHPVFTRQKGAEKDLTHPENGQVLEVSFAKKDRWNVVQSIIATGTKDAIPVKNWKEERKDLQEYVERFLVPAETLKEWIYQAGKNPTARWSAKDEEPEEVDRHEEGLVEAVAEEEEEEDEEIPQEVLDNPAVQELLRKTAEALRAAKKVS